MSFRHPATWPGGQPSNSSVPDWQHWVATVATLVDRGHVGTPDAAAKLAGLLDSGNTAGYVSDAVNADTDQWIDGRDHLVDNGYELSKDGTQISRCHRQPLLVLTNGGIRIAPNGRLRRLAAANHTDWGLDVEVTIGTEIALHSPITVKFIGYSGTTTVPYYGVFRNDISRNVFLKYSQIRMWDIETIDYIDVPAKSRTFSRVGSNMSSGVIDAAPSVHSFFCPQKVASPSEGTPCKKVVEVLC